MTLVLTRHIGLTLFLAISASVEAGATFTPLGDLAGGSFSSQALCVSANGTVVVGQARSASGDEAFRWTAGGGMVGLGDQGQPMARLLRSCQPIRQQRICFAYALARRCGK